MTKSPSLFTAADELAQVLDPEHVAAVIEFRKVTIKKPITAFGAKLLAREFAKCPDPNAAAEYMINKVWRSFDASWMQSHEQRYQMRPNAPPLRGVDALKDDLARRIAEDEQERATGARGADPETDRGLSLIGWEGNARPH